MSVAPVVIIGSGLAGLMTALQLSPQPVVLVTKSGLGEAASSPLAQGGIAASMGADDNADLHLADTLVAGDGLCDPLIVSAIVEEGAEAIALLERLGVAFDRNLDCTLTLGLEAAHSRNRIVHAGGDASGAVIIRALVKAVVNTPSITVMEATLAQSLVMNSGHVVGVQCLGPNGPVMLGTHAVVLATGGIGGLYDATTNPLGNVGQGIALAARAGASLADMEFVQFHPTALDVATAPLPLISEAVRGEGAILVNHRAERFMDAISGKELAPRDVVARAISAEIAAGGNVYLDARAALPNGFAKRFPAIDSICRAHNIVPDCDPIPVRPAAHYHMGGVETDAQGRTSVSGLWAVGEVAATGLHGANRLASNSLLEAVVMAMRAAKSISDTPHQSIQISAIEPIPSQADVAPIRAIVSRYLGVLRDQNGLACAIEYLLPQAADNDAACVALLMAVAAWQRTESRGSHARTDFPAKAAHAQRSCMTLSEALNSAHTIIAPALIYRSA